MEKGKDLHWQTKVSRLKSQSVLLLSQSWIPCIFSLESYMYRERERATPKKNTQKCVNSGRSKDDIIFPASQLVYLWLGVLVDCTSKIIQGYPVIKRGFFPSNIWVRWFSHCFLHFPMIFPLFRGFTATSFPDTGCPRPPGPPARCAARQAQAQK